ncbi:unnamed protein product [Lasius platythorax]|uniref:Uncharacterized protein n=1 Tax=Lasius platythorax TaxID=488582 RepID=A0AAV2P3S0_9HYME
MAYGQILRSDLQDLLDKYKEIRDKFSALYAFSTTQQTSLECEREQSRMMRNRLKNMLHLLMKREGQHKVSLDSLEKENKQLYSILAATQRECERDKLLNKNKVSKLQGEIEFLRVQVVQLEDKHRQQLMSQDKRHEDEILKYKRRLESADAKLLLKQNVASEKFQGTKNGNHPAFINDENMKRKKSRVGKLPGLEIVKVVQEEIKRTKRRKLFQKDEETVVDII